MQRKSLDALKALNEHHLEATGDPEVAAHQLFRDGLPDADLSPELMDISKESKETLEMYGVTGRASFAMNCLLARRLVSAACASYSSSISLGITTARLRRAFAANASRPIRRRRL